MLAGVVKLTLFISYAYFKLLDQLKQYGN